MVRVKKAIHYLENLSRSEGVKAKTLGNFLRISYNKWLNSLCLTDFIAFMEAIKENKEIIGVAQFFGKFRAISFEEYIYRLIQTRIRIPRSLDVYWGEKCLVSTGEREEYGIETDISIGSKKGDFVQPLSVIEAKVELDASRLKTSIASFAMLKCQNPDVKCFIVYMKKEVDSLLMRATNPWVDGFYEFSKHKDDTDIFIHCIMNVLKNF
jgi:hypothetical protein